MNSSPSIPVSWGELIDKITILEIKAARLDGPARANAAHELGLLTQIAAAAMAQLGGVVEELRAVNRTLWDAEDQIRDCERAGNFGDDFVQLARKIYITNDARARLKRAVNTQMGSALVEEKTYKPY